MTLAELPTLLEEVPGLTFTATALLGLIVGSFLNVVILRLPRIMEQQWRRECEDLLLAGRETDGDIDTSISGTLDEDSRPPLGLARPASHCPSCQARIKPWDNIPVLSWLLLRGRCRACQSTISVRYPLIEALTAILSLLVIWQLGPSLAGGAGLLLTWGLIALAVIDLDTQLLPDDLTLPLLWAGLLLSLTAAFTDPISSIIGASAGYMSLWLVFQVFRLLTGKAGMGYGDFKLLAVFGAWFGWQALPQILLFAALTGAITGVALIAMRRHQAGQPIPFGPFLAAAGWISMLWGEVITSSYLRWSGLA